MTQPGKRGKAQVNHRDAYGYHFKVKGAAKGKRNWARYKRKMKDLDPLAYTYANKRSNAQKNGKTFRLSLEQWREIWEPFTDEKGQPLPDFHIDRIDKDKGYEAGNVQILKGAVHRAKDYGQPPPMQEEGPEISYIQKTEAPARPQDDDLPF